MTRLLFLFAIIVIILIIAIVAVCYVHGYAFAEGFSDSLFLENESIIAKTEITDGSVTNILPISKNTKKSTEKSAEKTTKKTEKIKIIGKCKHSAKIMPLLSSDNNIIGYLIIDGGFGYEEPPVIKKVSDTADTADTANTDKNTKNTDKNTNDISILIKGQNRIIELLSKYIGSDDTQQKTLDTETIVKYANEYDKITKAVNDSNKAKQDVLEKTLKDIQADKKNADDLYERAKKLGIKDKPPLKYNPDFEKQINSKLQTLKSVKQMTADQKAKCYLLYNDMTDKSNKAEDYGQRSESNPSLRTSAQRYGQLAQNAISLYNSTCLANS